MPQEVLLTTSSLGDSSILVHDLHNSSHIQTFRQCATIKGGVALTNSKSQFLAAQLDKGVVHVYSWGKDSVGTKMILPEKILCLQISPSGSWCVGGSESGKLFLWEVL
jgi:pre-rRNA-processing protein IPI3